MAERINVFQNPDLNFSNDLEVKEEEIRSLYERLISAIQDPTRIVDYTSLGGFFSDGFYFFHDLAEDRYSATGLKTIHRSGDGTIGHPGISLSVRYSCTLDAEDHQPTQIPEGTPIVVGPLAGLRERFVLNGTLEGSGLKTRDWGNNTNDIADTPPTRESFNRYKGYLENASFTGSGLKVEFMPNFPTKPDSVWRQALNKIPFIRF